MSNHTVPLTSWIFRALAQVNPRYDPATTQLLIDHTALPPFGRWAIPHILPQNIVLYLQAWLLVYDGGRHTLWRATLWPLMIAAIVHGWFAGRFVGDETVQYNFMLGCGYIYCIVKSTEWAFTRRIPRRIAQPGHPVPPAQPFRDAVSLCASPRMVGWQHGIPYTGHRGILPRSRAIARHAQSTLIHFLLLDLCMSGCQILFPTTLGTLRGADIYYVADDILRTALRFLGASPPSAHPYLTVIFQQFFGMISAAFTGLTIYGALALGYHAAAFLGIAMGQGAEEWPPFMDRPWRGDSLLNFWSKRWHGVGGPLQYGGIESDVKIMVSSVSDQLFKQAFIAPTLLLPRRLAFARRYLLPLSAFAVSATMHELGSLTFSGCTSPHLRVARLFVLSGVGMLAELLFHRVTGRRVCGRWGAAWMWLFLMCTGAPLARTWLQYGLGGVQIIPEWASVFRGLHRLAVAGAHDGRKHG